LSAEIEHIRLHDTGEEKYRVTVRSIYQRFGTKQLVTSGEGTTLAEATVTAFSRAYREMHGE
jgi:uncharacterized protein (DUF1330 family)